MKQQRVLILAEGKDASNFIASIVKYYLNIAEFDVIYQNSSDILDEFKVEGINFYKIPFSNFMNLNYFNLKDYSKIIIVIKNKFFALNALKSVQSFLDKNITIEFVDFWGIEIEDEKVNVKKIPNIITSTLIDVLPNVPVFARNIGLGLEEIMEVQVPVGSSFVYRNISLLNDTNKNWRIVALYRNDKLILPNKMTFIQAYDKLLIVGNPNVLKDVFKTIKKDVGLFPAPYGNNLYLFLDRKKVDSKTASKLLKSAIFLQRKLKSKKLFIRIKNPTLNNYVKLNKFENIEVHVDYYDVDTQNLILQDLLKFNIGMLIIDNKFYYKNIDFLLKIKKPFLKVGDESIKKCDFTALLISEDERVSEISPVVFDIANQLNKKIKFFDFDPENIKQIKKETMIYYENLAKIYYYKNVEFIMNDKNPYFEIKDMKNGCFFIPFNKNIPRKKLLSLISPNTYNIQILMDKFNQIMIPTKE